MHALAPVLGGAGGRGRGLRRCNMAGGRPFRSMVLFLELIAVLAWAVALVGGLVLIGESRRRRPDHYACGQCRYDLTGLGAMADRCPECGVVLSPATVTRPREVWCSTATLYGGIGLVLLGPLSCLGTVLIMLLL